MTYKELYESAADKLEKSKITLGEFEKVIEPLNAEIDTDSDMISRQVAISAICNACGKIDCDKMDKCEKLQLPPANCSEFPNNSDTISRQAAIDVIDSFNVFESRSDQIKLEQMIGELPPANNSEIPNSSDTISRAKAIEAINKALDRQTLLNRFVRKVAIDAIKQLPPAQPERIRGRWTRDNACSECGCQPWFSGDIHNYNFCPNCGAEMEVTT